MKTLIKKDLLILKPQAVTIIISLVIFFVLFGGGMGYLFCVIYVSYLVILNVQSVDEASKATVLMGTFPMPRSVIVRTRYAEGFLIYAILTALTVVVGFVMERSNMNLPFTITAPSLEVTAIAFLVTSLYNGITIPLMYKYGFNKMKYVSVIIYAALMAVWGALSGFGMDRVTEFLSDSAALIAVGFVAGAIITFTSYRISVRIIEGVDFA